MKSASFIQTLANRRIAIMLPLGFASGLPLALTAGTLQAWLTVVGLDLKTIGIFTLVGLPYTLKFLASWLLWWPFSLPHSTLSSTPIGPMCWYARNGASVQLCG